MKCFRVNLKDISNRLDPFYLFSTTKKVKIASNFQKVNLGNLLVAKPMYGANTPAIDGDKNTDYRYIRITDIDEFGTLKEDSWKTAKEIDLKYLLQENDILFARSGATAGKTFIYKSKYDKAIFAGYMIKFKIDTKKAEPDYIFYYTQTEDYKNWVQYIQRAAGQPNINAEEYKAFQIPLPDLKTQKNFIDIMNKGFQERQRRLQQAKELLVSIDKYVLSELGIKLPELKDKTCFTIKASEVKNNRIDTYYYQPKFQYIYESIKNSKYSSSTFENIIEDLKNGVELRSYTDSGFRYLRVSDLSETGLIHSNVRFVSVESIPPKIKLSKKDFLISRSGSLGLVSVVSDEMLDFILSSHIFKVKLKTQKINPHYLEVYLRSSLGQFQFFQKNNGGIVPEISQTALKSLEIILPPLETQQKIADKVKSRMDKAKQLQIEARQTIEQAKKEAEKTILGEK